MSKRDWTTQALVGTQFSTLGVSKDTNFERLQHRLEFMCLSFEFVAIDVFAASQRHDGGRPQRALLRCPLPSSHRKYSGSSSSRGL